MTNKLCDGNPGKPGLIHHAYTDGEPVGGSYRCPGCANCQPKAGGAHADHCGRAHYMGEGVPCRCEEPPAGGEGLEDPNV